MARPRTVSDEEIFAAVTGVVGRVGPARLTLAAVAREVGLSPATLVQRFGSKRALLLELRSGNAEQVRGHMRESTARAGFLDTLVGNLTALAAPVADPVAFSNHLAVLHQDLSDPEFHLQAREYAQAMREEIHDLLVSAAAAGELRPVDLEQLARTVESVYNGALITWAVHREDALETWLRRELDAALAPWRTGSGRHSGHHDPEP
ncbi:AcrR family transcriptional regulator [Streptosporangium becharense]|uniref:AcrR family transcriptional regulator n=1 Tax=Streptosporangium becharense TaxID=1816182 RepID=A0A7W9ME41_9ACTN|nr:helix-turn-helix domain-containing protein [Streptosporangium becharense]MBB2910877.1 AcrR family transcriptional regulator [Streptosporangium becharense]MBB5817572.1 AcrR family transcriptional regulator [Streptosporangium becharense]